MIKSMLWQLSEQLLFSSTQSIFHSKTQLAASLPHKGDVALELKDFLGIVINFAHITYRYKYVVTCKL